MRLTLRTLLAYLDDTLEPHEARELGQRLAQSDYAKELVDRIKKATRRRGLATPMFTSGGDVSDPNTVAEYLSDALNAEQVEEVETNCLASEAHLAEIAACHQILTLVLAEPVRVPPTANRRMYKLVRRPASLPNQEPGRTMPIGRQLPAEDLPNAQDEDAALLLGMRRYRPGGPVSGRIFQASLVVGLAVCFLIAIVMALPDRPAQGPRVGSQIVVAAAPTPKVAALPAFQPPKEKPAEVIPPKPEDATLAPLPRLVEVVVAGKLDAPQLPQPAPAAAPPLAPRIVRKVIGKLESADQVVVLAKPPQAGLYERINAANPEIDTADSILALPGYKAKIRLNTGVVVDLWANTPEQFPNSVLETRLRFHEPPEGYEADLTLQAGRIFLTTTKPGPAHVRLRIAGRVWDVTLTDERSEAIVEVMSTLDAGSPFIKDAKDSPRIAMAFAITKGTVGVNFVGEKDFGLVAAPKFLIWDSKGEGIEESNDRSRLDYFGRFPLPPPDPSGVQQSRAIAMQKVLSELASSLTARDGSKTRIAEILSEEPDFTNLSRVTAARYAVYAAAAIDEPSHLVEALNSGLKPFLRDAATFALERWLPLDEENSTRFYQQLLAKQVKDDAALAILKMLRRYSPDDLKRSEVLDSLVNLMETSEIPAVRELAFWTLTTGVDPSAGENPRLSRFDAGGTLAEREPAITAWKQRLVDIKKKIAEEKQ